MEIQQPTDFGDVAVTSLNGLTGDVVLAAGANITLTPLGNTITIASTGGGGTPGGLNLQVQYNNGGVFGGISGAVTNGTILNLTNPLIGGGTLTTSTVNGVTLTTGGSANTFLNGAGNYTVPFTITTTGTSGAATFISNVLNVPRYDTGSATLYVPYTGATTDVDLGSHGLTGNKLTAFGDGQDILVLKGLSGGANTQGLMFQTSGAVDIGSIWMVQNVGDMNFRPYFYTGSAMTLQATTGYLGIGSAATSPASFVQAKIGVSDFRFSEGNASQTPTISVINTNAGGKAAALAAGTGGSVFAFDNAGIFGILAEAKSAFTGNTIGTGVLVFQTDSTGKMTFNKYGSGTFTGTTSKAIEVDASGNIIEFPVLSLTTTGTSGAATYNTSTRVLNIPNYAGGGSGVTPRAETPSGTVNGSNTAFTLANTPSAALSVIVVLDGLVQRNGSGLDYTVSGTTITFAGAPATGTEIFCYYSS